jgi:hypothetical protein
LTYFEKLDFVVKYVIIKSLIMFKKVEINKKWVVPENIHVPPRRKFLPSGEEIN